MDATKERRRQLDTVFENVGDAEKLLIDNLLDEVVYLEQQMRELKKLPFIETHPRRPELQRQTKAAKLYKECSQSYMNAIRILLSSLRKTEPEAINELQKALAEFET